VTTGAVVPAAGRGDRLGPGAPKALRTVAGRPLLGHAVDSLLAARSVQLVVVAAPPGEQRAVARLIGSAEVTVVAGGATRRASVARALAALPDHVDVVIVHDAARPVLPVVDTVKRVREGRVTETVDRAELRAVQTPQGFRRSVLAAAHAAAGTVDATDDAGLVEALGRPVLVVEGHPEAFKVTRPVDLLLAEAVYAARRTDGHEHAGGAAGSGG
jgi:2-C-methyl-D-erythritol 4-phosphate cytidylyltransferase